MVHIEMRRVVLGLSKSGYPCQQMAPSQTCTIWILWERQHPQSVVPHNTTYLLHPCCWCFWSGIWESGGHCPINFQHNYDIQAYWGVDQQLKLCITLDWDYEWQTVDISMLGYIKRKLQEHKHSKPFKLQSCPYFPEPEKWDWRSSSPSPQWITKAWSEIRKVVSRESKIVSSILYYAHAVDMTVLMALSMIAIEQTKATETTKGRCIQLLDYLLSQSEAKTRFHASDMIMNIHSNA